MIGNALVIGFFTAIGWFSAQRLMDIAIDSKIPTQVEQKNKETK
jgi:hypothetical protein